MFRWPRIIMLFLFVASLAAAQEEAASQYTLHSSVIEALYDFWSYVSGILVFASPALAVGNVILLGRQYQLQRLEQSPSFRKYLLVSNFLLVAAYVTKYAAILLQHLGIEGPGAVFYLAVFAIAAGAGLLFCLLTRVVLGGSRLAFWLASAFMVVPAYAMLILFFWFLLTFQAR